MSAPIRRLTVHDGPWLEENPPPPTAAPPLSDEEQEALWWHWRQQLDEIEADRMWEDQGYEDQSGH